MLISFYVRRNNIYVLPFIGKAFVFQTVLKKNILHTYAHTHMHIYIYIKILMQKGTNLIMWTDIPSRTLTMSLAQV